MHVLNSWWLDLKLGVRMLRKHPGISLAGGAGIAVAVALAAGGFSVIYDNFLTASVPLDEGDRIVSIEIWDSSASKPEPRILRDYHVWRQELRSVQEISAFRITAPNLIASGVPPESVRVAAMTASGFTVARVRPLMGRHIEEKDDRDGAPPVMVIGENVWRNRFASDPAILGRTVQLGAASHSIVGVMPKGFAFPVNDHVWIPLRAGFAMPEPLTGPPLMVFGRLAPGATLAGAQAELAALGARTALAFPQIYQPLHPLVMPYPRPFAGIHQDIDVSGLLGLQGIFFALLILVCLNVTILVYTRTAMRQSEIRLRTALGASRGRIVLQLFIEAFVLSAAAALTGVAIAALALRWVASATLHVASQLPFWMSFRLSSEAVLYAVLLSVFAAAIVGIVPALQATRSNLQSGLKIAETGGMRLGRTWTLLIIAQVGFAVAFLPPALAAAWNDARDGFAGLGFAAEEYLSAQLGMDLVPGSGIIAAGGQPVFTRAFAASQIELIRRLEVEPQVSRVSFAMFHPGNEGGARIEAESAAPLPAQSGGALRGAGSRSETDVREVRFNRVDVNFLRAFEVPVLAGRVFEPADLATAGTGPRSPKGEGPEGGAIVVNLPFAQHVFAGNALGRRIRYVDSTGAPAAQIAGASRWYEIVGIVADFPIGASPGMRDTKQLKVYHAVAPGQVRPAAIAIRIRHGAPAAFTQRLREIAAAVDPNFHLSEIQGLDNVMRSEQWLSRMTASVFLAITLSVLLLSSAGIYALMSFTVSQRRKEIGIRIALGAAWSQIVFSIFSRALGQLASGAALGAALGLALENASGGVLLRGNGAVIVPIVSLITLTVGFLAALGPARRGIRIEPAEALREH